MDQRIQGKNFDFLKNTGFLSLIFLYFSGGGGLFSEKILNLVLKFIKIV
ncbi:hypothetical protein N406_07755 [Helicobacter pylori FD577]|nr:hypothetical protein N406_07755 [Helicobacter pylori FD577]